MNTKLVIKANCHAGHIQIPTEGIPLDAQVVVVFLSPNEAAGDIASAEQHAALMLQSQSGFAQSVLMNPAEDCWNNV